jgi:hypothetical protein
MKGTNIRIRKLEDLAEHLRFCRECGETDVMACHEGRKLWIGASMPDVAEGFSLFADGKLGCAVCGKYVDEDSLKIVHDVTCAAETAERTRA